MKNLTKQKLAVNLGNKIKETRLRIGYTQKELAERCGMLEPNIGAIERGVTLPTLFTLIKIANALDLESESLFDTVRDYIPIESSQSEDEILLQKIGFRTIRLDNEDYLLTFNKENPFYIIYDKNKLNKIISDITKVCELEKQRAIEEKLCAKIFEDFLNRPYNLRHIGNLTNLTPEIAEFILSMSKK